MGGIRNRHCERNDTYRILVVKPEVKDHFYQRIDGRLILKWIIKKWNEGLDWNELARNRKRWRAAVYVMMNFRLPYNAGNLAA
jgi:hypothetical protein